MSQVAISVNALSKQYRIGGAERFNTLRDTLAAGFAEPLRRLFRRPHTRLDRSTDNTIWALKDVSFDVTPGEVLGVVGRNGSGKSTLLKILSRITTPTEGSADIRGRVLSLLEVGTGFHPELTGRENIYLNGAILGMRRAELDKLFDQIVEFAEVATFVDTPVKHYSSGMYLRLAFSVAAHMRSSILLVDEVLAVGDAAFQKKCTGKMGEAAYEGRTVIFVSHNMAAIRSLCHRGILLNQGQLVSTGDIEHVLFHYSKQITNEPTGSGTSHTYFANLCVNSQNPGQINSRDRFTVSCTLHLGSDLPGFRLFCTIQDANGEAMAVAPINHRGLSEIGKSGYYALQVSFPTLWLKPGIYSVFFKLLGINAGAGKGRFLSDSMMLDVGGESDPELLLGCMTPEAVWKVERINTLQAVQAGQR